MILYILTAARTSSHNLTRMWDVDSNSLPYSSRETK